MALYKNRYRIESARYPGWDYAANGWYFVTICTRDRRCFLGDVVAGQMQLSGAGQIVQTIWQEIPHHFPHAVLDAFVVMPNHVHGIIGINRVSGGGGGNGRGAINRASTIPTTTTGKKAGGVTGRHNPMLSDGSLSKMMRWYKGRCKFEIGAILPEFAWQSRFYDRIVWDEGALNRIRGYIANNPRKWERDRHHSS